MRVFRGAAARLRASVRVASILFGSVLCVMAPLPAQAALVTYGGVEYDVTGVTGSYVDLASTLTQQVWWGSSGAASTFAAAVKDDLGLPNVGSNFAFAPMFAFAAPEAVGLFAYGSVTGSGTGVFGPFTAGNQVSAVYAVATRVAPVPEPTLLTLLGCAAAAALGRRVRAVR